MSFKSSFQKQFLEQLHDAPMGTYKISFGIDMAKREEPSKLYPHKFFVQFHRDNFMIYSGEKGTFTKDNGETITYNQTIFYRVLTFCTIHPIDTADFYYGQAVLNPKDKDNIVQGCKEAFNHAVWDLWQTEMKWKDFAKIFFDALLKKNLTEKNILDGFVLKVKLPWEAKKHGH